MTAPLDALATDVLARYGIDAARAAAEPLGNHGGFSGARLWRLQAVDQPLCLRCWPPEHPTRGELQFVHVVIEHAARLMEVVPAPWRTTAGESFVSAGGRLWELTDWMPGAADYALRPTFDRLLAAMSVLGQFHQAVATFPARIPAAPSPTIVGRLQLAERYAQGLSALPEAVERTEWPEFQSRGREIVLLAAPRLEATVAMLRRQAQRSHPLRPCLRDVWHRHILFEENRVSGLVDFGAVAMDHAVVDVARLLRSLAGPARRWWDEGLAAYERHAHAAVVRDTLEALDYSSITLAGPQWLEWIAVERRRFDDRAGVLHRLDEVLALLRASV